jgi:hypothetical protein
MDKIKELPPDRISRDDASQLLGVSSKAIDRYTKPGQTKPAKLKSKKTDQRESGGFITHFDRAEVEALKRQMESGETEGHSDTKTQALERPSAKTSGKPHTDIQTLRQVDIGQVLTSMPTITLRHALPITEKAGISVEEAIEISGMGRAAILRGVSDGKIKHDRNGPKGSLRLSTKDVIKYASSF